MPPDAPAWSSSRHARRHVASRLRVGRNDPYPASGFLPRRLRGRDGPVTHRAPCRSQSHERERRTRSACWAWGRCCFVGSCPSAGSSFRFLRSGHRGQVLGGTQVGRDERHSESAPARVAAEPHQGPRCQLHCSQRCRLCFRLTSTSKQARTRRAAPRATPGPLTSDIREAPARTAPVPASPPVHGARADVGVRTTRHENVSPVRT